jgi:hypothetical protein
MSNFTDIVPWRLKSALRAVLDLPDRRRWQKQRRDVRRADGTEPVLCFGGVLDDGRLVRGGAVKLLSLQRAFRCDEEKFNILYLVSSAPPHFAEDLVVECRRKNIAVVWNQNGVGYPGWAGGEADRHNAPMRRLRALADFIVYQSDFCLKSANRFLGPVEKPSRVLLNPVDLSKFHPARCASRPAAPRLLAMGTHAYRDRVFAAIDTLHALRREGMPATLTVAGSLQWRRGKEETLDYLRELGVSDAVLLQPAFDQEEAPHLYRAHDILVHPKYLDPCPTVVAEALACGLPVVGSATGGLPEMTDAACARLLPLPLVWDRMLTPPVGQLAAAVVDLWGNIEAASIAARARAERKFEAAAWTGAHREIFRSLLSR